MDKHKVETVIGDPPIDICQECSARVLEGATCSVCGTSEDMMAGFCVCEKCYLRIAEYLLEGVLDRPVEEIG